MKLKNRAIHRDLGYFYLGLILSFSLSGILLNHRQDWHLTQYTIADKEISVDLTHSKGLNSDSLIESFEKKRAGREKNHGQFRKTDNAGTFNNDSNKNSIVGANNKGIISETFADDIAKELGVKDKFRRQFIQKGKIRLAFVNHNIEIDIKTGKGHLTEFKKTPILGQIVQLHRDNSVGWICYSDIFAISLIIMSITGIIIPQGKKGFRKRGWILTIVGLIFPLIILYIIS